MSQYPTDLCWMNCGAAAPLELKIFGRGGYGVEQRVFEYPFVLVGRHEGSCLRLDDGAVSKRHAYLQQLGGRVFCVDLGSRSGTRWGGEPRPAGWFTPERGIQIGPFALELAVAAQYGEGPGDSVGEDGDPLQDRTNDFQTLPRITVEVGDKILSRTYMSRMLVLVGSSPACRIRLRDAAISRYHCSLVRTSQGVWFIDLLSRTGARHNGQSLRWALMKAGDRLQVGPYVLRVWYPDVRMETSHRGIVAIPAIPLQGAEDTSKSAQEPFDSQGTLERDATEVSVLVTTLQAVRDQARERQHEMQALNHQLSDSQAERARLRERSGALEVQVAEAAGLQARLQTAEASVRELDDARGEHDRWQAEVQNLQDRLATLSAEWEQLERLAVDAHATQAERDRLQTELQSSRHSTEQAWARVSDLEQALTDGAAAHTVAIEEVRARWELERQALEARLELERQSHDGAVQAAAHDVEVLAAERAEWRQWLEIAQQQFAEAREAVRATHARLDQESTNLQQARADLANRNAEYDSVLRQLQEAQHELVRSQFEARGLRAELDQAIEHQQEVEALRQQLADAQTEPIQLRARLQELESCVISADRLQVQLRDAEAETERLRVQLHAAESQEAELEAMRIECARLHEGAGALDVQVAEVGGVQAQLQAAEVSALELDDARGERDRQVLPREAEPTNDRGKGLRLLVVLAFLIGAIAFVFLVLPRLTD